MICAQQFGLKNKSPVIKAGTNNINDSTLSSLFCLLALRKKLSFFKQQILDSISKSTLLENNRNEKHCNASFSFQFHSPLD